MKRAWRFAAHDRQLVRELSRALGCAPLLAQILAARGVRNRQEADRFMSARLNDLHEPGTLPGVPEASERIVAAIRAGRRITIYGDYDVDGVTATAILYRCCQLAGAKVDYYIPSRLEEGYGLNSDAVRKLSEEDPGRLVITVDCGICSLEEAALARSLGLELIITDHHTMTDRLPDAASVVHPRLPGHEVPFGDLCGAGVAFKLAWGICQQLGDGGKASPAMRDYLVGAVGLAAIGTVADVVPLVDENRILVRNGLLSLQSRAPLGLQKLMDVAKVSAQKSLVAEDIGFSLAPRLNAAGRLGQARLAVELLVTEDEERAVQLATYVDQLNKNRQTVERRMLRQAKELITEANREDDAALVLAHPEWHPGVIGIVAGRIAEKYQKPTVLIALDEVRGTGSGSARSFAGFDLHSGLAACAEHLEGFGGHRAAAGLRISRERIGRFRERFVEYVQENHVPLATATDLTIDAEVSFNELTRACVREIESLGPFGCSHRRPVIAASSVSLVGPPKKMGGGERHLSMKVRQGNQTFRAVAFGCADWADEIAAQQSVDICFTANINCFRGFEQVELQLIDWQPCGSGAVTATERCVSL